MRILQINATYGIGSTGKIVRDISEKLLSQNHESFVMWATRCKSDQNYTKLIRIGTSPDHKLHALLRRIDKKQGWHSLLATKKACRQIKEIKPDVVHLHNLHSNYIHLPTLLEFLRQNGIPTLLTLHDCWFFTGGCNHYLRHDCLKWQSDCTDCKIHKNCAKTTFPVKKELFSKIKHLAVNGVSKWTAETAEKSILNTAFIKTHIYNWIDTEEFKPSGNTDQVRKLYNIPPSHRIILGVSQGWSKGKGLDEFLKIATELKDCASVVLVGDSSDIPDKSNLICIDYTTDVKQLIDLYCAAEVLVNPSQVETFGLVTAEALACGTPVVAYNNTGTAEIITSDCGLLVQDGDSDAMLEAVVSVLNKGKAHFSDACRERVLTHFEKNKQTDKYINLYNQILKSL